MVQTSCRGLDEEQPAFGNHILPRHRYFSMPDEDIGIEDSLMNVFLRGFDQVGVWNSILHPLAMSFLCWKTVDKVCHFLGKIPIFEQ